MIPLSVPEIEGGSPEHDGEGLVLEYSSSWMVFSRFYKEVKLF